MSIFDIFRKKKKIPAPWKKYYTEEELNFTIPDINLYKQIVNTSNKIPDSIAYRYFNTKVKYKDLIKKVDKIAISFKKLGVKKGDVVTICLPNVPEAIISVYALNKLGAIANMIHPLSAEEEIRESLTSTNSKYLIMIDMFYSKIKGFIMNSKVKRVIFVSPSTSMDIFLKIGYKLMNIKKRVKIPKSIIFTTWNKFIKLSKHSKMEILSNFGKEDRKSVV